MTLPSDKTMRVFLSHAHADREWAEQFRSGLSRAGFEVWNPMNDLAPGSNPLLALGESLEQSEAMVVLLSPDSVQLDSVIFEIEFALSSPRFRGRLVSVLVRPTAEIPWILQKLPFIRATKDKAETVRRVITALEKSLVPVEK